MYSIIIKILNLLVTHNYTQNNVQWNAFYNCLWHENSKGKYLQYWPNCHTEGHIAYSQVRNILQEIKSTYVFVYKTEYSFNGIFLLKTHCCTLLLYITAIESKCAVMLISKLKRVHALIDLFEFASLNCWMTLNVKLSCLLIHFKP